MAGRFGEVVMIARIWRGCTRAAEVRALASEDVEKARYYEEDKKYLLEFEPTVTDYDLSNV
jgi:hypothetical protein